MAKLRGQRQAFGHPGIEPRWTHGSKDGIGTAYSASSCIWFTLWNGVVTEIYYPTIDQPQMRDLQYLVSDGKSFFHDEKRHLESHIERAWQHALGYRITNYDPDGRYAIHKDIISDPHLPTVLQRTRLSGDEAVLSQLRLYALCAPHLNLGGWGNSGYVMQVAGRDILVAENEGVWLALAATVPFKLSSCGYVGASDGWQDLADNYQMDWEFDQALDGNIALTGELDLSSGYEFTLAISFGDTLHRATTTLFQSLDVSFHHHRDRFIEQWERTCDKRLPLHKVAQDDGTLYDQSISLILAHEDKTYQGAMIASLSIPWGQVKGDESQYGGYHFVWPRDMVNSATALIAAGETETPLRALIYLAMSQQESGGFPQNFWIDGTPERGGAQLDEVAFPILLAWRLHRSDALRNFDPYPMVMAAARYLIYHGPATEQERWEQSSGYSPATLAVNIAALICAACWVRERGDQSTAQFIEDYADFLECHIESWTVTTQGTLVPDIPQHYIRIHPARVNDPRPDEDPNQGTLYIPHRHPDAQHEFPAKDIVDPSFLELVRYGVRSPHDPVIQDSVRVVDAVLKTDTPFGPVWRRYNHDGHGQREDGSAWQGWGTGRSWPLLTAERGHYELAAGGDVSSYIRAMEQLASCTGLLPEQVWDDPDRPDVHMYLGRPTGSSMPLIWAHGEYVKLLRSTWEGQMFDYVPNVGERYRDRTQCQRLEIWKLNRQVFTIKPDYTLRIQAPRPFRLRWSADGWASLTDTLATRTQLGIEYVDIPIILRECASICFTFFWTDTHDWQEQDYTVTVQK
ncbi:MAG: glycoside hydrolase family 15 protein [Elainellaceae cyanobacterium]